MRALLAIALLWPLAALAQISYSPTVGTGYQDLHAATVRGAINVRVTNANPPVAFTLDGAGVHTENLAPFDLYGDAFLWDTTKLPDGPHTLTAAGYTANFTIRNTQQEMRQWLLSWIPPTKNEDGSVLTDLKGFRVEGSASVAGPWSNVWTGFTGTSEARVTHPGETACFRIYAVSASAESDPSAISCSSVDPARPNAPVVVGDTPKALSLVSGASTGTRAVYSRSATDSRGTKVGDLKVGPVNGDFARIECDPADSFQYGTTRYSRVKVPLDGYVSGCYSTGLH